MDRYKLELGSAGRDYVRICKAITSGYFFHAARKDAQDGYKSIVRPPPAFSGSVIFYVPFCGFSRS